MQHTGTVSAALAHARRLLGEQPALAARQADAVLEVSPGHPEAVFILGAARRALGDLIGARAALEPLSATQPRAAVVHFEWAVVQALLGQTRGAQESLRLALDLNPDLPGGWRLMGDLHYTSGALAAADAAYARHLEAATADPRLMAAGQALVQGELKDAEQRLSAHLAQHPTDVATLRLLAETLTRQGRDAEAQILLERCLDRAPSFKVARHNLAVALFRQNKPRPALAQIETLLAGDAHNPNYRSLKAACHAMLADYEAAIALYRPLLAEFPDQPKVWMSFGHALKTVGRREEAIGAYRQAIAQNPSLGEAHWSLANMKTLRWAPDALGVIQAQISRADLTPEDRFHLHYTLGHAFEQRGAFEQSWRHYAQGARIRRGEIDYDAGQTTARRRRLESVLTRSFFEARADVGCTDEAPIFIVGLPRSGSTLIEQILASHSTIEGTMELAEISNLVREIGQTDDAADDYPECLAELAPGDFRALGARYLEETRTYRKTGRPTFIDKMPNNFVHAGFIHLILPRAKIIDARRQPMASCFSAFKQHFARGQNFSYDLEELGRYYLDYVALMEHFDTELPGRILRVRYEDMVEDQRAQTLRLLDYCGVTFEPACLNFHENTRAVRTASSEQVRQPIYRSSIDNWKHYEAWLGPLAQVFSASGHNSSADQ